MSAEISWSEVRKVLRKSADYSYWQYCDRSALRNLFIADGMRQDFLDRLEIHKDDEDRRTFTLIPDYPNPNYFDTLQVSLVSAILNDGPVPACKPKQKEEEVMNINYDLQTQRRHLNDRLYGIVENKIAKLRVEFHLSDDEAPKTPSEYLKRIADGKFTVPTDEDWKRCRWNFDGYYGIRFRDPKAEADQDGFDAATEALYSARQKVEDEIAILEPAQALKSVQEFETATFH